VPAAHIQPDRGGYTATAPGNNYLASLGSTLEFAGNQTGGPPNGVFQYNANGTAIGIRDITDGTTNIVFYGQYPPGVTRNTAAMSMPAGGAAFQQWIVGCTAALKSANRGNKTVTLGQGWAMGMMSMSLGTTLLPPNSKYTNCSTHGTNTVENPGMMNMSSFHPGGASALMVDGSVRFLKDSTSMTVVRALGSRAQGRDHRCQQLLRREASCRHWRSEGSASCPGWRRDSHGHGCRLAIAPSARPPSAQQPAGFVRDRSHRPSGAID
jgi:prepilin-type processing-associated H-X9-DG protein